MPHKNIQKSEFLTVIGMLASRFIETCQTISTETYLYDAKMSCKR